MLVGHTLIDQKPMKNHRLGIFPLLKTLVSRQLLSYGSLEHHAYKQHGQSTHM